MLLQLGSPLTASLDGNHHQDSVILKSTVSVGPEMLLQLGSLLTAPLTTQFLKKMPLNFFFFKDQEIYPLSAFKLKTHHIH